MGGHHHGGGQGGHDKHGQHHQPSHKPCPPKHHPTPPPTHTTHPCPPTHTHTPPPTSPTPTPTASTPTPTPTSSVPHSTHPAPAPTTTHPAPVVVAHTTPVVGTPVPVANTGSLANTGSDGALLLVLFIAGLAMVLVGLVMAWRGGHYDGDPLIITNEPE